MNRINKRTAAALLRIAAALAAAVLCELLLFNLKSVRTAGREWSPLPEPEIYGDLAEDQRISLVFGDLYAEIRTCHVLLEVRDSEGEVLTSSFEVYLTDDGNKGDYPACSIAYTLSHDKGSYFLLNPYGRVHALTLVLTAPEAGCTYSLLCAETGGSIPFRISRPRIAGLFLLFLLAYLLRPSSALYDNRRWNRCRGGKALAVLVVLILNIAALIVLAYQNRTYVQLSPDSVRFAHHFQYASLARSLAEGKTWIDTPSEEEALRTLAGLANPYDYSARAAAGVSQIWDTAYYNGHLYVYFGVVPVLLAYLPYYLLTGSDLPTLWATVLSGALCVITAFAFMRALIQRYFPETPFPVYVLLSLLIGNGTGVLCYGVDPCFYIVPISTSLFLVLTALTLWLSAAERIDAARGGGQDAFPIPAVRPDAADRMGTGAPERPLPANTGGDNPNALCFPPVGFPRTRAGVCLRIAAGSLCAALTAGCRPQFLVFTALALPIFLPMIPAVRKKVLRLTGLISFAVPYVAVSLPLMYYNAVRFGSPFDLGANYNLTTNDMTRRGFHLDRLWDGFYAFLVQMPNIGLRFPYIHEVPADYIYSGKTISEPMFGGVLIVFPFLWLLFRFRKALPVLRRKRLAGLAALSATLSLIVVAADTEMSGILWRYTSDFLLLLYLSAILIFLALLEEAVLDGRRWLLSFLYVTVFVTLVICLLISLTNSSLIIRSPGNYYRFKDLLSIG